VTRHTMHQRMHIESTPREDTTTKVDLDMDEPINRFMKTKKKEKLVIVYIMIKNIYNRDIF